MRLFAPKILSVPDSLLPGEYRALVDVMISIWRARCNHDNRDLPRLLAAIALQRLWAQVEECPKLRNFAGWGC